MTDDVDGALLLQMRNDDPAGLSALYDRHATRVLGLARRILGAGGDAEDTVQEVFFQAWNQRARYDESRGAVLTWLLLIARSRALDRLRGRRVRLAAASAERETATALRPAADDPLLNTWAAAAVSALPPSQRLAIELAYFGGYTHREIATLVKQPLGTVKTRIRKGMLKLREAQTGFRTSVRSRETPFTISLGHVLADPVRARNLALLLDGVRVLVVDDDPDTLEMVGTILECAGASVMLGRSTREALDRMAAVWPDVLLADLAMPGENGFDLVRKARALERDHRRLRAGAFTALTAERDRLAARTAGYDIYLTKPIQPDAIVRAVRGLASPAA